MNPSQCGGFRTTKCHYTTKLGPTLNYFVFTRKSLAVFATKTNVNNLISQLNILREGSYVYDNFSHLNQKRKGHAFMHIRKAFERLYSLRADSNINLWDRKESTWTHIFGNRRRLCRKDIKITHKNVCIVLFEQRTK